MRGCAPRSTRRLSDRRRPGQRYLLVGGIRSTGLTAGMAIAEHVRGLLSEAGLGPAVKAELPSPPRMPNLGEAFPRPYQDDADRGRPGLRHASLLL